MTDAEKAKVLDWLLTPVEGRADRPANLNKQISRNHLSSFMVFMAWDDPAVVLERMKKEADAFFASRT